MVVLELDEEGNLVNVASNISPELVVKIVNDPAAFSEEAANKPFVTQN